MIVLALLALAATLTWRSARALSAKVRTDRGDWLHAAVQVARLADQAGVEYGSNVRSSRPTRKELTA